MLQSVHIPPSIFELLLSMTHNCYVSFYIYDMCVLHSFAVTLIILLCFIIILILGVGGSVVYLHGLQYP